MSELQPLGQYIKVLLEQKRQSEGRVWSQNELARRSGVSRGGLSMIINGKTQPTAASLRSIADALTIDATPLLALAGIVEPSRNEPDIEYIANRLASLPEHAKPVVLSAVRGQIEAAYALLEAAEQQPKSPINHSS